MRLYTKYVMVLMFCMSFLTNFIFGMDNGQEVRASETQAPSMIQIISKELGEWVSFLADIVRYARGRPTSSEILLQEMEARRVERYLQDSANMRARNEERRQQAREAGNPSEDSDDEVYISPFAGVYERNH